MFIFNYNCPTCGAYGKLWKKDPDVFICPRCSTVFSRFGVVLETEEEHEELWN